jgi:2-(1,2-epoxy-1,2-dihydrophenyl)acetyl-CoA isomerase
MVKGMSEQRAVRVHRVDQRVMQVTFGRPPNNFLEPGLVTAIADASEEIATLPDARVIVLASEGKHFCAGGDFSRVAESDAAPAGSPSAHAQFSIASRDVYAEAARLMAAPLPVVAAVQGAAVGGGLGLACTADFRTGSPETRLVPNFAQLGVHHGFGLTVTLPRIVGWQRANELLLTGRRIGGEEGYRLGLLDQLVPAHELEAAAIAFAAEIATSAPLSIRAIRATMREGLVEQFRAATERESREQAELSRTQDFREGVRAYAERRPPRFAGR